MNELLPYELLDADQQAAITRLVEHDHTLLVAGMGAGKTVIAATAISELLAMGALERVLVVAPLKVVTVTWPEELARWAHLDLRVRYITGTAQARAAALRDETAQVFLINFENLAWLCKTLGDDVSVWFDGLLVDESTRLKAVGGVGFKRLRRHLKGFAWRVGLSGTPVSENLLGLYGQMLVVSAGAALGRSQQAYLDKWFVAHDYDRRVWLPREGAEGEIAAAVAGWVHVMPDYRGTLPELAIETVPVAMPAPAWEEYRLLARESVLEDVTAANEAVLTGKLQQVAAGFVYLDPVRGAAPVARAIHAAKWEVLNELLADESPAIVVYWWAWQRDELLRRGLPLLSNESIERWNVGELRALAMHPRSGGHGLNLQHGGARMIFLSPWWSRDMFDQVIARVWRRGQVSRVQVHILVATDTADVLVMERLEGKAGYHARFVAHLTATRGTVAA